MAIVNAGTAMGLPKNLLPTDYVYPTVTAITNHEFTKDSIIEVAKDPIRNADMQTMMDAFVDAVNVAVTALVAADFLATGTTTHSSTILSVSTNMVQGQDFWEDEDTNYLVSVRTLIKHA